MSDWDDDDDNGPVVIDMGSGMTKSGFGGDDAPRAVFPSVIGRPFQTATLVGMGKTEYAGDEAQGKRGVLKMTYPIENGIVKNWDDWEKLIHHNFYDELRVAPEDHNVLMTEPPLNPSSNREKKMQLLFETFSTRANYFVNDSILSLYASGKITGIVLDCGDGITSSVPIYEGYSVVNGMARSNIAGRYITHYLMKILCDKAKESNDKYSKYLFTGSADRELVRDIKEKLGYTALNFQKEMEDEDNLSSKQENINYELPDGQVVTIDRERFRCTEIMFNPNLMFDDNNNKNNGNGKFKSVQQLVYDSINCCEKDVQSQMYPNIVLAGGSTMFTGFTERVEQEMKIITTKKSNGNNYSDKIGVTAPAFRKYSVWIGGSIMSKLSTFETMWVTKEQYDETGSSLVHRKYF